MPREVVVAVYQPTSFCASMEEALATLESVAAEAKSQSAEVLVLPELFLGGYLLEDTASRAVSVEGPELRRVSEAAKASGVSIVVGFAELPSASGQPLFNSAAAFDGRTGQLVHCYRKTHLFGPAETKAFAPGDSLGAVFELAGVRCSLLICFDIEFPENARACALGGAELLLVPTANMQPYSEVNNVIVPCRAVENRVPVVYANWGEFTSAEGVPFLGQSIAAGAKGERHLAFQPGESGLRVAAVAIGVGQEDEDSDYLRWRRPELYGSLVSR